VWDGPKITVSFDKNGDGKPDPNDTIVLNDPDAGRDDNSGGSAPAASAAPSASTAPAPVVTDAGATDGGNGK